MTVLCNWAIRGDLSVFTSFFQRHFIPSTEHLDGRNLPCHVVQDLPQHFIHLSHWFKLVDSRYLSRLLLNSSVQSLLTCPQQSMVFRCLVCWKAFPKRYSEYPPADQSHGLSCTYWTWRTSKLLPLASLYIFFPLRTLLVAQWPQVQLQCGATLCSSTASSRLRMQVARDMSGSSSASESSWNMGLVLAGRNLSLLLTCSLTPVNRLFPPRKRK